MVLFLERQTSFYNLHLDLVVMLMWHHFGHSKALLVDQILLTRLPTLFINKSLLIWFGWRSTHLIARTPYRSGSRSTIPDLCFMCASDQPNHPNHSNLKLIQQIILQCIDHPYNIRLTRIPIAWNPVLVFQKSDSSWLRPIHLSWVLLMSKV